MHEYSIVSSLLSLCEKEAKKQNAKFIKKLTVRLGRLSGVEPHLLKTCFDVFKEDTICHNAILILKIIEVKLFCHSCQKEYVILDNNFLCHVCQSDETNIVNGQEMLLESIEISGSDL